MDNVYSIVIVQQCKMLEAPLSMDITIQQHPSEFAAIIRSSKKLLVGTDYDLPLSSALTHPSVEPIARIASGQLLYCGGEPGMVHLTMELRVLHVFKQY